MCLVGFGVCENAVLSISNCFALIVVLGPRRFEPLFPSSGDLFSVCESRVSGSPSREPRVEKFKLIKGAKEISDELENWIGF